MRADGSFVRTRFEWLDILSNMSEVVRQLDLKAKLEDIVYKAENQPAANKDAFNFAGSDEHSVVIARVLDTLYERGISLSQIETFVINLTGRNIYGAFCELCAYDFLMLGGLKFDIQVPVTGAEILNPNGSDLDGVVMLGNERLYFDAKAFGFTEHLAELLLDKLNEHFQPDFVKAQESLDVSVDLLSNLLGAGFNSLKTELQNSKIARRGPIMFSVHEPSRVQVSSRVVSSAGLASENKDYVFRYAKQFVRKSPFFLFFVVHPWVSSLRLTHNFGGLVDEFMSEFAQATFTGSKTSSDLIFDLPRSDAAKLLAGMVFIDAWQGVPAREKPFLRCYINSHAANPLSDEALEAFTSPYGDKMRTVHI